MGFLEKKIYYGDCNTRVGTLFNAVHTAHEAAAII
jgi:hypothetical protein